MNLRFLVSLCICLIFWRSYVLAPSESGSSSMSGARLARWSPRRSHLLPCGIGRSRCRNRGRLQEFYYSALGLAWVRQRPRAGGNEAGGRRKRRHGPGLRRGHKGGDLVRALRHGKGHDAVDAEGSERTHKEPVQNICMLDGIPLLLEMKLREGAAATGVGCSFQLPGKAFIIGLMLIKCVRVDTSFGEVNSETEKDNR
jgi:hypothetical protein